MEKTTKTKEKAVKPVVKPEKRRSAIDFIADVYCIACPYKRDCSSKYPDYLLKCTYLEKWALKKYEVIDKGERP